MSTRPTCTLCHTHKAELPAALCKADLRQLHDDEQQLLDWYDALLEKPKRGSGNAGQNDDHPLPMNAGAERERQRIRRLLVRWVQRTGTEYDLQLPQWDEPIICLQWLTTQPQLVAGDLVVEYAQEIHRAVDEARSVAAPDPEEGLPIGVHQVKDKLENLVDCGKVWATTDGWATCKKCGEQAVVSWWQEQWPQRDEDPLTVREAAIWLAIEYHRPVKEKDIRNYLNRVETTGVRRHPASRMGKVLVYRGDLRRYADAHWLPATTLSVV